MIKTNNEEVKQPYEPAGCRLVKMETQSVLCQSGNPLSPYEDEDL